MSDPIKRGDILLARHGSTSFRVVTLRQSPATGMVTAILIEPGPGCWKVGSEIHLSSGDWQRCGDGDVSAVDELIIAATVVLRDLDQIHPPTGAFWSGANNQERLRAVIAQMGGRR